MIEVNETISEREALAKSLKAEIRKKMELMDTLKFDLQKHEYELYTLYSKLDELDLKAIPLYMQNCVVMPDIKKKNKKEAVKHIKQAG